MSDQNFYSPMFGETRHATEEERKSIKRAVQETPVAVFQEINRALRERGLMLAIDAIPDVPPQQH